jgi:hypothetical protein
MAICITCGAEFKSGHIGYMNKCLDCSFNRKPTEEQQHKWQNDSQFFVNLLGERVYYEVVRSWTVQVPVD